MAFGSYCAPPEYLRTAIACPSYPNAHPDTSGRRPPRPMPGNNYWSFRLPHPCLAIVTSGVADCGMAVLMSLRGESLARRLSRVPHVVSILAMNDRRPVDIIFPSRFQIWSEHDLRSRPVDAIRTLRQRDRFLRPPRKPHAKLCIFVDHGNVKAGPCTGDREQGFLEILLGPGS